MLDTLRNGAGAIYRRMRKPFDARNDQRELHLFPDHVIPDGNTLVLRVKVQLPFHEDSVIELEAFDGQGNPISAETAIVLDSARNDDSEAAGALRIVMISTRIPDGTTSCTLSAHDKNHPELQESLRIDEGLMGQLHAQGGRFWFHATLDQRYDSLFRARRADACERAAQANGFSCEYLFSIVVPLFKTPLRLFQDMLDSVLAQSYGTWELVLVDASPEDEPLAQAAHDASVRDERVRIVMLEGNRGIAENTNAGIEACKGDFVCFLDHDDTIEPDTLHEYARALEERDDTDMIYCDEDKLSDDGSLYYGPFFKPDFDVEWLRCSNYVCHFLCVRKSVLDSIPRLSSQYDGAQDHHLALLVAEHARHVHHVPKVLYHWRATEGSTAVTKEGFDSDKMYAHAAGRRAISDHLERCGLHARLGDGPRPFSHHVTYLVQGLPLVSIIIRHMSDETVLVQCAQAVADCTQYGNVEVIVVDGDKPISAESRVALEQAGVKPIETLPAGRKAFPQCANDGASKAQGAYLLFLDGDLRPVSPEWIATMVGLCQQDGIGAVGAHVLLPDGTTQHAGMVIPSLQEGALSELFGVPDSDSGHLARGVVTHNCIAVSASCMMTPKTAFDQVGGFDESFSNRAANIDYCLKLREAGLRVVYEPMARLMRLGPLGEGFYEGGTDGHAIKNGRESDILKAHWPARYNGRDPYYNPNLTGAFRLGW